MAFKSHIKSATAFAHATSANFFVGFDILGFPIMNLKDEVTLTLREDLHLEITDIDSNETLPFETRKNTATVAIHHLLEDLDLEIGFDIKIKKGIPLCSGLGGSAASAVAALTAVNAFLQTPLSNKQLAPYALKAEAIASEDEHADNIVPCLWGELTLVRCLQTFDVINLPMPELYSVIVHPDYQIPTKLARGALNRSLQLSHHVQQSANLSALICALYQHDWELLKRASEDTLVEPQREHLLPGFKDVKFRALREGALACSYSGAGPTLIALATNEAVARKVCLGMQQELSEKQLKSQAWVSLMHKALPGFLHIEECE